MYLQLIEDLLYGLEWNEGRYRFVEQKIPRRPYASKTVQLKEVLPRCLKHLARRNELKELVPNSSTRFVKVKERLEQAEVVKLRMTQIDLRVFEFVHPARSVGDLPCQTHIPHLEVTESLAKLHEAGLIAVHEGAVPKAVAEPEANEATRVEFKDRRTLVENIVHHGITALLVIAMFGVGLHVYLDSRIDAADLEDTTSIQSIERERLTRIQIAKIGHAADVYKLRHGNFPLRLEILVEDGLLTQADLTWPHYEREYVYKVRDDHYFIIRPKK